MLEKIIGEMVESLGSGHLHGGAQDAPGLPGQSLGGLAQQFQAGIGEEGMRTASGFQGLLD